MGAVKDSILNDFVPDQFFTQAHDTWIVTNVDESLMWQLQMRKKIVEGTRQAVDVTLTELWDFASDVTPVWTGAWMRAHRTRRLPSGIIKSDDTSKEVFMGEVYVSPIARNPVTGDYPRLYGAAIENRGVSPKGHMAPYRRTILERAHVLYEATNRNVTAAIRGLR